MNTVMLKERSMPMADEQKVISLGEAAERLGVTRPTLYYYMERLDIKKQTFKLDKRVYLNMSDFEQIKRLREATQKRHSQKETTSV
jgi:DNA-binding transcriptional MerR regulator